MGPSPIRWPGAALFDKSVAVPVNTALSPRTFLWTLRVATVATAALVGLAVASAGEGRADGAALPATIAWWVVVAALVVALVVPGALGLTVVRMLTPLGAIGGGAAFAAGADTAVGAAALALGLITTVVAFSAEVGEAMVQGAARARRGEEEGGGMDRAALRLGAADGEQHVCHLADGDLDGVAAGGPGEIGGEVKVQCSAHGATATATISPAGNDGDRVHVSWHSPQRRIAPGQSVVFYDATDAYVLGGGIAG